jgi:hypothetical protein
VSHSVSVPLGIPRPSEWHILKQTSKAMVIENLLVLDHFGHENSQTNVYPYGLSNNLNKYYVYKISNLQMNDI